MLSVFISHRFLFQPIYVYCPLYTSGAASRLILRCPDAVATSPYYRCRANFTFLLASAATVCIRGLLPNSVTRFPCTLSVSNNEKYVLRNICIVENIRWRHKWVSCVLIILDRFRGQFMNNSADEMDNTSQVMLSVRYLIESIDCFYSMRRLVDFSLFFLYFVYFVWFSCYSMHNRFVFELKLILIYKSLAFFIVMTFPPI